MRSFFFNAEPTSDLSAHPTGYDREYDADDHAAFFAPFFSEAGVMAGAGSGADACKVVVESGNTLRVKAGCLYVRGRMCQFDGTETIQVTENCRICARMNKAADVRGFQLVAVAQPVQSEDIYDLELAQVVITTVSGGYAAQVTDTRTFLAFMGQPAYYPPEADHLPYVLWLYTLGFPLSEEQRAMVAGNPSLMEIFNGSLGAARSVKVSFTTGEWGSKTGGVQSLVIPRVKHGRQTDQFCYTLRQNVGGSMKTGTWGTMTAKVSYDAASGNITLTAEDAFAGEIVFTG